LIYFISISLAVYLLSSRYRTRLGTGAAEPMEGMDWLNLGIFATMVGGLIVLMAVVHLPPMFAALYVFVGTIGILLVARLITAVRTRNRVRRFSEPIANFIDGFSSMTADLSLLLATLSIMTGALVITGVPTKIGALLI